MARGLGYAFVKELQKANNKKQQEVARIERERQREQLKVYNARMKALSKEENAYQKIQLKEEKERYIAERHLLADEMTTELLESYDKYNRIIQKSLTDKKVFDFEKMKQIYSKSRFNFTAPPLKTDPELIVPQLIPVPSESWLEKIMPSLKEKRLAVITQNEEITSDTEKMNQKIIYQNEEDYKHLLSKYEKNKASAFEKWENIEFDKKESISVFNAEIDTWKQAYLSGEEDALSTYIDTIFSIFDYAMGTIVEYQAGFNPHNRKLVIDLHIADKDEIFESEGYRYIKQRNAIESIKMKVSALNERMKNLMIEVCIATFHVMFRNDIGNHFNAITVNVYYNRICCVSAEVDKETFQKHDFSTRNGLAAFMQLQMRIYAQLARGVKPFDTLFADLI